MCVILAFVSSSFSTGHGRRISKMATAWLDTWILYSSTEKRRKSSGELTLPDLACKSYRLPVVQYLYVVVSPFWIVLAELQVAAMHHRSDHSIIQHYQPVHIVTTWWMCQMCQVFSGYAQELGPILSTLQQKLRSDRIQLRIGFLESQHFPVCIWKALGRCCGNVWACLNFAFWGDHLMSPESQKRRKTWQGQQG